MEWMIVLSLLLFGLILIVAEIIFVPGTTIVGVIGFGSLISGVGLSFQYFGREVGWITVGGAAVCTCLVLYLSFKTNVWKRFALKSSMDSKVNEGEMEGLIIGQEGITLSALRPIGKAEFNGKTYQVKTLGGYLSTSAQIRIVQIMSHQIFVEPTIQK